MKRTIILTIDYDKNEHISPVLIKLYNNKKLQITKIKVQSKQDEKENIHKR